MADDINRHIQSLIELYKGDEMMNVITSLLAMLRLDPATSSQLKDFEAKLDIFMMRQDKDFVLGNIEQFFNELYKLASPQETCDLKLKEFFNELLKLFHCALKK